MSQENMNQTVRKTLTLSSEFKGRQSHIPDGNVLVGVGKKGWNILRYDAQRGANLSQGVGKWLLDEGLYSSGNDFTSENAKDPKYIGVSAMRNLWEGNPSCLDDKFTAVRIWTVVKNQKPEAVVALFHPGKAGGREIFYNNPNHLTSDTVQQVPVDRIGHLMAYVRPHSRQQGLLRWVLSSCVLPEIENRARRIRAGGAIPLLGGSDAMGKLLANYTDLPITGQMEYCPEMNYDIWSIIRKRAMMPERVHGVDQYLVEPQTFRRNPSPRLGERRTF